MGTIIKVPEGLIKRANDLGLLSCVKIYYRMKPVNPQGFIKFGSGISEFAKKLCTSERTVRRWISSLVKVGFMYKDGGGYGLVKYDTIFSILGLDVTENTLHGKSRLGRFKIFKIRINDIPEIIAHIAKEEILLNQNRQEYMDKSKPTPTTKPDIKVGNTASISSMSCSKVASIMGFKSKSTGHSIEKALKKINVIIDNHLEVISVDHPMFPYPEINKNGYYKVDGIQFKVSSNRIYIPY